MPYCPECGQEFEEGIKHCQDCRVDLVPSLSKDDHVQEIAASSHKLVTLLTAPNRLILERAKSILENQGIPALIDAEAISILYGSAADFSLRGTHLKVLESAYDKAKRILCEQGIRCEVFSGWVEQFVEHVFKPSLQGKPADFKRVLDLLQSQTAETRQSLFARLAGQKGQLHLAHQHS